MTYIPYLLAAGYALLGFVIAILFEKIDIYGKRIEFWKECHENCWNEKHRLSSKLYQLEVKRYFDISRIEKDLKFAQEHIKILQRAKQQKRSKNGKWCK